MHGGRWLHGTSSHVLAFSPQNKEPRTGVAEPIKFNTTPALVRLAFCFLRWSLYTFRLYLKQLSIPQRKKFCRAARVRTFVEHRDSMDYFLFDDAIE